MYNIIEDLNWRYAVDRFDPDRKVSNNDLHTIIEAVRLAPSSYGLQPLKLLIIENQCLRNELFLASYNQQQVADCSHLLLLCAYNTISSEFIDEFIALSARTMGRSLESYDKYASFLKRTILQMDPKKLSEWNKRQAFIALGHLLHTCAQLKIDSTPMEGFENESYNNILGLSEQNLNAVVACPIGYRSKDDEQQFWPKIRRSVEEFTEFYT
jgi:nitroreductase/dihydropteridine reductase